MLIDRCNLQAGNRVLIWGAAGGLGVFATQLCALTGAESVGVVSSAEKGALLEQLGATGWIDRNEYAGMMRRGGEDAAAREGALQGVTPVLQGGRGDPRRPARHRLRARRQGDLPDIRARRASRSARSSSAARPRATSSISTCATCGCARRRSSDLTSPTPGRRHKANELIEQSKIRPVLWQTMGFDAVAEAHQLMRDNKHLGKIAILVGAGAEGEGRTADGLPAIRAEVGT